MKHAEMFPTTDPRTWNEGIWPPPAFRVRWRELFTATMYATSFDAIMGTDGDIQAAVQKAMRLTDWALRAEMERLHTAVFQ